MSFCLNQVVVQFKRDHVFNSTPIYTEQSRSIFKSSYRCIGQFHKHNFSQKPTLKLLISLCFSKPTSTLGSGDINIVNDEEWGGIAVRVGFSPVNILLFQRSFERLITLSVVQLVLTSHSLVHEAEHEMPDRNKRKNTLKA